MKSENFFSPCSDPPAPTLSLEKPMDYPYSALDMISDGTGSTSGIGTGSTSGIGTESTSGIGTEISDDDDDEVRSK